MSADTLSFGCTAHIPANSAQPGARPCSLRICEITLRRVEGRVVRRQRPPLHLARGSVEPGRVVAARGHRALHLVHRLDRGDRGARGAPREARSEDGVDRHRCPASPPRAPRIDPAGHRRTDRRWRGIIFGNTNRHGGAGHPDSGGAPCRVRSGPVVPLPQERWQRCSSSRPGRLPRRELRSASRISPSESRPRARPGRRLVALFSSAVRASPQSSIGLSLLWALRES